MEEGSAEWLSALRAVGSIVNFGHYEQDNDFNNGAESIEWLVLDVQEGKSLLISKYALDCRPYHTDPINITWENSSVRNWLKEYFLKTAFSPEEQNMIPTSQINNDRSQGRNNSFVSGGNDTEDQVFLLSYADAVSYFSSNDARACEPTEYAKANGVNTNGSGKCWWWLRSPGKYDMYASYVSVGGATGSYYDVSAEKGGVRPVLWVEYKENEQLIGESDYSEEQMHVSTENELLFPGNVVEFGHYEQDNNLQNGEEPIEWIVLDVQDGMALLISRYGVDSRAYHTSYENMTWEKSSLRNWLNTTFLQTVFSPTEQDQIQTVTVDNGKSQGYSAWGTDGGKDTEDQIFLLSHAEAEKYFATKEARICMATEYTKKQGAMFLGAEGRCSWWLRSPGTNPCNAECIAINGALKFEDYVSNTRIVVRPVLWIDLNSDVS